MIIITSMIIMFAVLILIIVHYNFYRYLMMHLDISDETSIKNYMQKKRAPYQHKIIVSLTTSCNRVKKLKPMIKSILNQTVRIDQIALNVSKKCKVPEEIEQMVNVYVCGREYGEGTKCIPTILRETDSETLLILLEDNYIYNENFIETVVNEYNKNSEYCLYSKGVIVLKCGFMKEDIIDVTKDQVSDKLLMRYIKAPKKKIETEHLFIKCFY